MCEIKDSVYYEQLARAARLIASNHPDPDVARRLREAAIKHERKARQLARKAARAKAPKGGIARLFLF